MNTTLQSEVTGTVWKIEVQEGDTVQPDQSLL
ncbi:MAG: biotin/lipoyl-containing protein, partial [Gammaproteobacteria bacterium]